MPVPRSVRRSLLPAVAAVVWVLAAPTPASAATTTTTTTLAPASAPAVDWSVVHPATSPPALEYAAAAYDGDTRTLVLFGGRGTNGKLSADTWVWDGTNWSEFPGSQPPPRELASMSFDPTLHQLILFGGQGNGGTLLDDTWAWNGQQWVQQDPAGPAPSAREAAAMAYDSAGRLALFGGTGDSPTGTGSPDAGSPNAGSAVGDAATAATPTADPPADSPVALGDTWQWTGTGWIVGPSAGPPARSGAQMAYDSKTGATILFSGEATPAGSTQPTMETDTWSWDGAAWTQATTTAMPPARYGAVFGDDPPLGGPLLLGGTSSIGGTGSSDASGALADGWMWSTQGWVEAHETGAATPPAGAAGGYDGATSTFVVFGGTAAGGDGQATTEVVTASVQTTVSPPAQTPPNPAATTTVPTAAVRPTPTSTTTTLRPTATAVSPTPTTRPTAAVAPRTMTLVANLHTVRQGAAVQLSGGGFRPGAIVTISFHSKPELIGELVADGEGRFTTTVAVPRSASPGAHHFVAEGLAPTGGTTQLVAAVYVLGLPRSHGPSPVERAVMIGLALLIPGATWAAMSGSGWWRRRHAASR